MALRARLSLPRPDQPTQRKIAIFGLNSRASPRFLGLAALMAIMLGHAPARAQSQEDRPTLDEARGAFVRGMELLRAEQWERAQEKFGLALKARRTPGLLYYVAYCLEQQGRYVDALSVYKQAQELLEAVDAPDVESLLPDAVARAQAAIASLRFDVQPSDAQIVVDGEVRSERSVPLDPGDHAVLVRKGAHESYEERLVLARGEDRAISVRLVPAVEASVPAQTEATSSTEDLDQAPSEDAVSAKPYVVAAAGVLGLAGLGVGLYFTIERAKMVTKIEDLGLEIDSLSGSDSSGCVSPSSAIADSCSELDDALDRRKTSQAFMIAGYSVFGVGAAAAVLTQLLWKTDAVQVSIAPGGGYLGWSSQF